MLPALALLFFCSGACALVYQTLWLRMLALIFGVTVHAASTVLASFMAGLAIGSFVAGRRAPAIRRPLAVFGVVEMLVGLCALGTPIGLDAVKAVYLWLHPGVDAGAGLVTVVRFVLAFLVLLVPTSLMGATLPLVLASSLAGQSRIGARASVLYAVNTAGAISGALVGGFLLIPFLGLRRSLIAGAVLNLIVGVGALVLERRGWRAAPGVGASGQHVRRPTSAAGPTTAGPSTGATASAGGHAVDRGTSVAAIEEPGVPAATRAVVLAVFALSGAVSLALEIVWFRVLVIFLRPTTYAFTIMLAAVLGGIAAGSALAAPLMRRPRDWVVWLAALELGVAIVVLSSFAATGLAVDLTVTRPGAFEAWPTVAYLAPLGTASVLAILPTALLLGAAFPVGLRLFIGDAAVAAAAERTGRFYAVNVCGAIVGALGAGFLLIPVLGMQGTLRLLAALTLGGALALTATFARRRPVVASAMAVTGITAYALLAVSLANPFDLFRARLNRGEHLLWREEGVQTTVAVHQRGRTRIMYLDGHHQANDARGTAFIHHRIGWLPTALHPQPSRALVIGLGGGATPGAIARFPGVRVDVVELSEAVVRGAAFFDSINFGLLRRPALTLRVDDGRNHLLLSAPRQYDVITADLILPNHAGAGNLYSAEYFRLIYRVLRNDGLVLQWIGADLESEYKLLIRTFLRVFPQATLWGDGSLLVAAKRPLTISRAAYDRKLADPATRTVLESFGIASFERLLGQYIAGPAELAAYVGEGDTLSDDRPSVEYFLSIADRHTMANIDQVHGDVGRHVGGIDEVGPWSWYLDP